jgi:hypothetical protein
MEGDFFHFVEVDFHSVGAQLGFIEDDLKGGIKACSSQESSIAGTLTRFPLISVMVAGKSVTRGLSYSSLQRFELTRSRRFGSIALNVLSRLSERVIVPVKAVLEIMAEF